MTKGIDKIFHLLHFINLWSPVLDRIPLRFFLKVRSHLKFYAESKLGLAGSQVRSRLDMISRVGNYLKFKAGPQEGLVGF